MARQPADTALGFDGSDFAQENRAEAMLVAARRDMDLIDAAANHPTVLFDHDLSAARRLIVHRYLPGLDKVGAALRHDKDVEAAPRERELSHSR
jgi:hypothetical protein